MFKFVLVALVVVLDSFCYAKQNIDVAAMLYSFEQQVKGDIGDDAGEKITEISNYTLSVGWSFELLENLELGLLFRSDHGKRSSALYAGEDENGKTVTTNSIGGNYSELWLGPQIRYNFENLFFRLAHGSFARRYDKARSDLPNNSNQQSGAFSTTPKVSWMFALGLQTMLAKDFLLNLALEYRIRYYDERGGEPLLGNVKHGTQDLTPLLGVRYSL